MLTEAVHDLAHPAGALAAGRALAAALVLVEGREARDGLVRVRVRVRVWVWARVRVWVWVRVWVRVKRGGRWP